MDIPSVFNDLICQLQEDSNCGLCWKFIFGGRSDYFNLSEVGPEEDCECVRVGILKMRFSNSYNTSGGTVSLQHRDWFLEIFAGIPSSMGKQFYSEVDGSEEAIMASKWSKYVHPISCCMEDLPTQICDSINCSGCPAPVDIIKWDGEMKLNYEDLGYDGWFISATLRENLT